MEWLILGLLVGGLSLLGGCSNNENQEDNDSDENNPTGEDINKAINASGAKEQETPVAGALVQCTSSQFPEETVAVIDDTGNMVALDDLPELTRKNITLEKEFKKCRTAPGYICPKVRNIEGNEWKNYEKSGSQGTGKELLNVDESYMICLDGNGIIYFNNSGQMKSFAQGMATLLRFVNEEIFTALGWDIAVFKSSYGNDIFPRMRDMMFQCGIVEQISVCMFIATIGAESGNGVAVQERLPVAANASYTEQTRGAGLLQVTGGAQKDFLSYLMSLEKDLAKLEELEEQYNNIAEINDVWKNNKIKNNSNPNIVSTTDYIANNYAVEASVWFWGEYDKCSYYDTNNTMSKMTLNEFICTTASSSHVEQMDKTFLASQYYVNGSPWKEKRLQDIAEERNNSIYIIDPTNTSSQYTNGTSEYTTQNVFCNLPNGWDERYADWEYLRIEMFGR